MRVAIPCSFIPCFNGSTKHPKQKYDLIFIEIPKKFGILSADNNWLAIALKFKRETVFSFAWNEFTGFILI